MPVDLKSLKQFLGNDEKFIALLIDKFIRGTPLEAEKLKSAVMEKNWERVREISHKLLSSTKIFSQDELTSTLEKIEKLSENKILLNRIPKLFSQFETSCKNSLMEIKKFPGLKYIESVHEKKVPNVFSD